MPTDERRPVPPLLSNTGVFADTAALAPAAALVAYDVNVPFWSDGAAKRRWVAILTGEPVRFTPTGEWGFPAGTVFVKHFERDGRRLETRLLVRDGGRGVYGVAYRWRPDQAEAVAAGHRAEGWYFPGPEDCKKCHTAAAGGVLGVNTRQLNRDRKGGRGNQLVAWSRLGLLDPPVSANEAASLPRLAGAGSPGATPEGLARSYLDANCGHCHRPGGAAADFDARYDTPLPQQRLVGAPARIDLGLDRARQVAPNDPWRSMVLVRAGLCGDTGMPPLAHEAVDAKGLDILRAWVSSLPGPPVVAPPSLAPRGGDFPGPVRVELRHVDPAAVVRYTLDGTPPGPASPEYTGPLRLDRSATVRARAFRPGHTLSVVAQDTFVIDP